MKLENAYKQKLMKRLEREFPGCIILHTDAHSIQGIPDRVMLYRQFWAALEVKKSAKEVPRPNQPYYVAKLDEMSFAAFIYPENEDEVIHALQQAFGVRGNTLVPESE